MKKYKYSHMSVLKSISGCWNLHNRHRSMRWIEGLEAWWGKHTQLLPFRQNTLKSTGEEAYAMALPGVCPWVQARAGFGYFPQRDRGKGWELVPFVQWAPESNQRKTATFLIATAFLMPTYGHLTPSSTACCLQVVFLGFKHSESDPGRYCTEAPWWFCFLPV